MDDSTNPRARAIASLAEMFFEEAVGADDIAVLEVHAIDLGHGCMAEALDALFLSQKPEGLRVHDIRSSTLATEIGDADFSIRRYRDRFGEDCIR